MHDLDSGRPYSELSPSAIAFDLLVARPLGVWIPVFCVVGCGVAAVYVTVALVVRAVS